MKFNLEKATIAELTESELDRVAGGDPDTASYNTCRTSCGCPPACDASMNCPTYTNECGPKTSMVCAC